MNKVYTIKSSYSNIEAIKSQIIQDLNEKIGIKQDFKVMIKNLDFRSMPALKAYWVLIRSVVNWSTEQGNTYTDKDFDEWFKRDVGLVKDIDMMPMWEMRYNKDYCIKQVPPMSDIEYVLYKKSDSETIHKFLGSRYIEKTRSISNKGDVTKEEMERLIETVLFFGSKDQNNVPDCFIKDTELENMLKYYDKKPDHK